MVAPTDTPYVQFNDLPFLPENLGTVLVSVLGGVVPGTLSGALSASISRTFDANAIFFGVTNVLVALVVSTLRTRGTFRRVHTAIASLFAIFVVQFVPNMLISWFLCGFAGGKNADLSRRMLEAGAPGEYAAHVFAFALVSICAVLFSLGVTLIVCTPSRVASSSS